MSPFVEHVHRNQLFGVLRLQVDTTSLMMCEAKTANATLQGSLAGVRSHVDNSVRSRPESFIAHIALVRPFVTVHVEMFVERRSH